MKNLPSASYLHECFDYNPLTGELHWKDRPDEHFSHLSGRGSRMWQNRFPGTLAGKLDSSGARQVVINHQAHLAHRIIWKFMTGDDPNGEIDHINRISGDNRWANLRLADRVTQGWNKGARKDSLIGKRGVQLRNGRYGVRVRIDGKVRRLGSFATLEEAIIVREAADRKLHGEFFCEDA